MATVIGKTSQRIDALLGELLNGGEITDNRRLLLTSRSGAISDLGTLGPTEDEVVDIASAAGISAKDYASALLHQAQLDIDVAITEGQAAAQAAAETRLAEEVALIEQSLTSTENVAKTYADQLVLAEATRLATDIANEVTARENAIDSVNIAVSEVEDAIAATTLTASNTQTQLVNLTNVTVPALRADLTTLEDVTLPELQTDLDNLNGQLPALEAAASSAQSAADAAALEATQAIEQALSAIATADTAQAAADGAIRTFGPEEHPTSPPWANGSTQNPNVVGDLWLNADGVAHRWNGTTWYVIPDSAAANALAAAIAAQGVADAAATAATNAYNRWAPTGQTTIDGGKITADSITAAQIGADQVTANEIAADTITATEIATGTITATEIGAGAITAEKLTVGSLGDNLIRNGNMQDVGANGFTANWKLDGGFAFAEANLDAPGGRTLTLRPDATNHAQVSSSEFPVSAGERYAFTALFGSTGEAYVYFRVMPFDSTGAEMTDSYTDILGYAAVGPYPIGNGGAQMMRMQGSALMPSGAKTAQVQVYAFAPGIQFVWLNEVTGRKVVVSAQIADGAITVDKVSTNAITANKLNVVMGGGNILENSSFDHATNSLEGWQSFIGVENVTSDKHGRGVRSVRNPPGNPLYRVVSGLPVGEKYTASVWVKNEGSGRAFLHMHDGSNGNQEHKYSTMQGVWERIVLTYTIPYTGTVTWRVWSGAGTSSLIDEAQFEPGDLVTAYTPKTDEILPGSINTAMLTTDGIDANVIKFGTMHGDRIQANTLTIGQTAGLQSAIAGAQTGAVADMKTLWGYPSDTTLIDGGDIYTNSINASSIAIADFRNYAYDGQFIYPTGKVWHGNGIVVDSPTERNYYEITSLEGSNVDNYAGDFFEIRAGETFFVSYEVLGVGTNTHWNEVNLHIACRDYTGSTSNWISVSRPGSALQAAPDTWQTVTGFVTIPAGYDRGKVGLAVGSMTGSNGNKFRFRNVLVMKRHGGELIVDGAIKTAQLDADAITAKHTITGATLQTQAEDYRGIKITSAGLLGYDPSGQAKFTLTPTGGLTLNNANVVAANITGTTTITGPLIQTDSGATTGIKLSSAGLIGYASGTPKFTLTTGGGLTLVDAQITAGTIIGAVIKTATTGERVEINVNTAGRVKFFTGDVTEVGGPGQIYADHTYQPDLDMDALHTVITPPRTGSQTYRGSFPYIQIIEGRRRSDGVTDSTFEANASKVSLNAPVGTWISGPLSVAGVDMTPGYAAVPAVGAWGSTSAAYKRGGMVTVYVDISKAASAPGNEAAAVVPVGFRPVRGNAYSVMVDSATGAPVAMYVRDDGVIGHPLGRPANTGTVGVITYPCA